MELHMADEDGDKGAGSKEGQGAEGTKDEGTKDEGTPAEKADEFKSPESKAAVLADLAKERAARKKFETELADLRKAAENDSEKALREARESTAAEVEGRYKGLIVRSEAKSALMEAGLTSGVDRMLRLVDLSAVTVEKDGTLTGLDAQVAIIKKDFADLFVPAKVTPPRPPRVDGAGKPRTESKRTSAEIMAERVLGTAS
jgi:hypothetical protein